MEKNKDNQQQEQFNFLKKKTPIAPQGGATHKGKSASNFRKKSGSK